MQNITEYDLSRGRASYNQPHISSKQLRPEDRFGFKTFRRSPPPHPGPYHPKQKLNVSVTSQQPERQRSTSPSVLSTQQEEYYRSIQNTLLCENRNLREHNTFLLSQIRGLFQHQKRQSETLIRVKKQCKELQRANLLLQKQLQALTGHTLKEIDRIQAMLRNERYRQEELAMSSECSPGRSETAEVETEETVNNNLEELKQKVKSIIYDPKRLTFNPGHYKPRPEDDTFTKNMALDTQNSMREKVSRQLKQLKITDSTAKDTPAEYIFDQQLPSPRSAALHLNYNSAEQRRSGRKR